MKYVTLNREQLKEILEIGPSLATVRAIRRINSGRIIKESKIRRLKDIYSLFQSRKLEEALSILERRKKLEKSVTASVSVFSSFHLDINYKKAESKVFLLLTDNEKDDYWFNLMSLSFGKKIRNKFHDHPLKDYSIGDVSIKYKQNLSGFRSFCLRADRGYNTRLQKDPLTESKAIICLYKPGTKDSPVTLYNIGLHDMVYNTDVMSYNIIQNNNA